MKKLTLLLSVFITLSAQLMAQVPNAGFESLNADGYLSNWGATYLFAVTIDTDGHSTGDSVVFDHHYFYSPTTDAHSGNYALMISNAMNYTVGECISGRAAADTDFVFSAWGSIDFIPVTETPANFNFYYKFLPVNNDTGIARMIVYDSIMNELGTAEMLITGTHSTYTYASIPVSMTTTGAGAFVSVFFTNTTGGHPATFGTRLLIDDITTTTTTGVKDITKNDIALNCYPTVATDNINLLLAGITTNTPATLIITDMPGNQLQQTHITMTAGKPATIAVINYPAGVYVATIITDNGRFTARFVK